MNFSQSLLLSFFAGSILKIFTIWKLILAKIAKSNCEKLLIILFNVKAGRLIFKSPIVGIISVLPTAFFIYRGSKPIVNGINNWIDNKRTEYVDSKDIVDAEVISKEEA